MLATPVNLHNALIACGVETRGRYDSCSKDSICHKVYLQVGLHTVNICLDIGLINTTRFERFVQSSSK